MAVTVTLAAPDPKWTRCIAVNQKSSSKNYLFDGGKKFHKVGQTTPLPQSVSSLHQSDFEDGTYFYATAQSDAVYIWLYMDVGPNDYYVFTFQDGNKEQMAKLAIGKDTECGFDPIVDPARVKYVSVDKLAPAAP